MTKFLFKMGILFSFRFQLKRPNTEYNHCKYIKNGQLFDGNCKEPGYCMYIKTINGD